MKSCSDRQMDVLVPPRFGVNATLLDIHGKYKRQTVEAVVHDLTKPWTWRAGTVATYMVDSAYGRLSMSSAFFSSRAVLTLKNVLKRGSNCSSTIVET